MIKNKTDHNENDFKLINEQFYLYDKSKDLKRRNIKSANPNKFEKKNDIKKFYLSKVIIKDIIIILFYIEKNY